jgi:hypothetical protein
MCEHYDNRYEHPRQQTTSMNVSSRLKFILHNDECLTSYVSNPLFKKMWNTDMDVHTWNCQCSYLINEYSYLVTRIFISDHRIQRLYQNRNINENGKLEE